MELKVLCLFLLIYCTSARIDIFTAEKKNHKAKGAPTSSLRRLAALSDSDTFKNVLLKPMLIERVAGSPGSQTVREHIISTMQSFGWSIEEDSFTDSTPLGDKKFTNIIATVEPLAPRRLTLACHYDSKYFRDFTFVAAIDSAVPCAMLLDIARTLKYTLWKNRLDSPSERITLQFIFFDGEEAFEQWTRTDSIYGARHLAALMSQRSHQVGRDAFVPEIQAMDMMILLDLIGTKDVKFTNWFSDTSSWFSRMQKIEKKLANAGLLHVEKKQKHFFNPNHNRYFMGQLNQWGSRIDDDHKPFLEKGVPIMHLISVPFPQEWHTEMDNINCLDFPTIDNINKILRVFVAEYLHLDTNPEP